MYHRVMNYPIDMQRPIQSGMFVSTSTFQKHLELLQSRFEVLNLQDLIDRLLAGKSISQCCALTFDDGWLDNYQNAFPLLQEFNLPATIFLTTDYIGTNYWFWPEKISLCLCRLYKDKPAMDMMRNPIRDVIIKAGFFSSLSYEAVLDSLIETLKGYSPNERQNFVEQFALSCGIQEEKERMLMNWNEVRKMADSRLVNFGSHTATHELLDQLDSNLIYEEINISKNQIEMETMQPCTLFAYPNGNYNNTTIKILKKIGFQAAVTTKRGFVSHSINITELPRIAMHEDISNNTPLFYWRILVR